MANLFNVSRFPASNLKLFRICSRSLIFYLCSLILHLAVFWQLSQAAPVTSTQVAGASTASTAATQLTVRLISADDQQRGRPVELMMPPRAAAGMAVTPAIPKRAANPVPQRPEAVDFLSAASDLPAPPTGSETGDVVAKIGSVADYFPVDRLTILPVPLSPIDLNDVAITDFAVAGKIDLTLLVNDDGIVVEVLFANSTQESDRRFTDQVVPLFKNARFTPAEIDGHPVKSRLQITIVTEKPVGAG